MMKLICPLLIIFLAVSCSKNPVKEQSFPREVPDHTPYISGLIQYSPDTTFHYPEVLVGYFTDYLNPDTPGNLSRHHYEGLYNLTMFRQVTQTSILFALTWQPEPNAIVKVRGPLGTPQEKEVTFTPEGNGVYGDKNFDLSRIPNGQYKLKVTLPDGRRYIARTHIPEATKLPLPDSVSIRVKYYYAGNGDPHEEAGKRYLMTFKDPANSYMRVLQYNSSVDRRLLLLKPHEHFWYKEYGNYWRQGIGYNIVFAHKNKPDTLTRPWGQNLAKPRNEIWNKEHWWYRASFFSKGIGDMFYPLFNIFTSKDKWLNQINRPLANAAINHDSTYLFQVSNIQKLGKDGKPLPKDSRDAIGFFAGVFTLYKQMTLYPIRTFDLDSVWTAWNKSKE